MPLRPQDIQHKEFRRTMRGLDEREVTDFLQQVGRRFEALIKDNSELRDKVEEYAGRLEQFNRMEDVLHNALLVAQETAQEVKANANKEASLIKQQAEQEAAAIRDAARQAAAKTEAAYAAMIERSRLLRAQVRGMLLGHLDLLEREERVLDDYTDLHPHDEAAAAEAAVTRMSVEVAGLADEVAQTAAAVEAAIGAEAAAAAAAGQSAGAAGGGGPADSTGATLQES